MTATIGFAGDVICLTGWGTAAIVVARRAESRRSAERAPLPWITAPWVVAIAGGAPLFSRTPTSAACAITTIALAAVAGPDARRSFIFDAITFPTVAAVIALAIACRTTASAVEGIAMLVGSFGSAFLISRGRLIGLGDLKAMFAIGAAFGPIGSLVVIFAASLSGIAAALIDGTLRPGRAIPFGPHLAFGASVALVAGDAPATWLGIA